MKCSKRSDSLSGDLILVMGICRPLHVFRYITYNIMGLSFPDRYCLTSLIRRVD